MKSKAEERRVKLQQYELEKARIVRTAQNSQDYEAAVRELVRKLRMIKLRKELTIACGHNLPGHGKCGQYHGHTYKVIVYCACSPAELKGGMITDFSMPSVKKYDHKLLNLFFDMPTTETLAMQIFKETPHCTKVEIWESDSSLITYEETY